MAIHFSKEKWIEIQECWKRIRSKVSVSTATTNTITASNKNDKNTLEEDVILMDNLLINNNNSDTTNNNKPDISGITSNEFNNIMNEIDYDIKLNNDDKNNVINSENEEYNELSKIQKDFITKPVMLHLFIVFVINWKRVFAIF